MGYYKELQEDFVSRTISLLRQYNEIIHQFKFEEQFNYTLAINCMLGLIVMPKEKVDTYIPNEELTPENRANMGLVETSIDESIRTLGELIQNLRHSIAHFDIVVHSDVSGELIDRLEFRGTKNQPESIANFKASEIFPFLCYYADKLSNNLEVYRRPRLVAS
ncbi:HEPN family nuclease [Shewanella nanhaiensis]|uniref:pEK499-p136 HEPN domain-containing protein n=1 Tax=Shewanella nanhaiensis TaxID=2864872 RepID=A0ABS7E1M9_9GAMM|nr:HEPN family nuclease [Shewanella nanhaiensis]MBW8183561.1 hypothetical protein [Shewanella nanhaiensis]